MSKLLNNHQESAGIYPQRRFKKESTKTCLACGKVADACADDDGSKPEWQRWYCRECRFIWEVDEDGKSSNASACWTGGRGFEQVPEGTLLIMNGDKL